MPDLSKTFDSNWVKAGLNTKDGDHIKFLDAGTVVPNKKNPKKSDVNFSVEIVRNGEVIAQKQFSLNAGNFKAVSAMYGFNSDRWVGKEMKVNVVKKQNPLTGELVNAVALSAPGEPGEVDIDQ